MSKFHSAGYTIVEVMVVLSVTGLMFAMVMVTLSGRQNRTEFLTSVRDVKAQIQQTISETSDGYYPSMEDFVCSKVGGVPNIVASVSNEKGTNNDCVFLGKVLFFGPAGNNPDGMITYSVAGLRQTAEGVEATTLAESKPTVIAPSTSNPSVPNGVETRNFRGGLTTLWVKYGSANIDIGAVGFVNTLGKYSDGSLVSGSQQLSVIPVTGSARAMSQMQMAEVINNNLSTSPVDPDGGIKVCLASGGTDQSGLITIGSNGRQLAVALSIMENRTCS